MAKTGPRPKPASEKQTRQIAVMFTPAEYRAIREAAGSEPLSGWIRARIREVLGLEDSVAGARGGVLVAEMTRLERMQKEIRSMIGELSSRKQRRK